MARWQYQARAEPVVVPGAAPPAVPEIQYREPEIPRLSPRFYEGFFALQFPLPVEPSFDWYRRGPDETRTREPLVREGAFLYAPQLPVEPTYSWLPAYPDFARKKQPLVGEGTTFSYVPQLPLEPTYSWLPAYPDFARKRDPLVQEGTFSYAPQLPVEPTYSWPPNYPDFARVRSPLVREGFYARVDFDQLILPPYDWLIQNPELVPWRRRPLTREGFLVTGQEDQLIHPDLDWFQQGQERVWGREPLIQEGFLVRGFDPSELRPTIESFLSLYPDFIWGRLPLVPEGSLVAGQEDQLIYLDLDWFQQGQEQTWAKPPLVSEGFFTRGLDGTELRPTTESFLSSYPDFIWEQLPLVQEGFFTRGFDTSEIAPSLDYLRILPLYPDVTRKRRPLTQEGYFTRGPAPTEIPLHIVVAESTVVFGPKTVLYQTRAEGQENQLIYLDLDWIPIYPDYIWVRGPLLLEGGPASQILLPETWVNFGNVIRLIDPDTYGATYFLQVHMRTSSASEPARARLYNLTDSTPVTGSQISTTSTTVARVISPALTLSGSKEYMVQMGLLTLGHGPMALLIRGYRSRPDRLWLPRGHRRGEDYRRGRFYSG